MAKLNFNNLNRPVLELTMADEAETTFIVTTPTEGLVEELEATLPELKGVLGAKNNAAIDACYDLAARLISCNLTGAQVTADDLRTKYWPADRVTNMLHLLAFYNGYMDFLSEIQNEKN
jgi:hypothetical protein